MKKLLIGTTALVAVGMAADGALAAEKIKLGLGGYWRGFFVAGDAGDNTRGHGLAREGEIYFAGETTLDNGLRAGANVQLEAETSGDQIDNSTIYFAGGFGRVIMGSFWGPGVAMHYQGPGDKLSGHGNFASHVHAVRPGSNAAATNHNTYVHEALNSDQIAYYTPRMAGFQLGIGYTPDGTEEKANGLRTDNDSQNSEILQGGVNYQGKFNDVGVNLSAVYLKVGDDETAGSETEPRSWALGGNVSFGAFSVGGSYKDYDADAATGDQTTWEVGGAYSMGALGVGVTWANNETDTAAGDDELTYVALTASYALGPGVSVMGGIQHYDWEAADSASADEDKQTIFVVGTKLDF
jgi:predicted porin